ncbi:MAG: hypothetical protein JW940_01250 [Polyangiaceae bacterium]|nr:hypothetical protein [Polyangiaceae bacterium]
MLSRLIKGLLKGLALGAAVAAALVFGLKVNTVQPWLGYVFACGTGLLAGLLTGKPAWAPGAKIEAGLKSAFGALLAAGGLFALRKWLDIPLDLTAMRAGSGTLGDLPAANLTLIAAALGALFELDNTGEPKSDGKTRVAEPRSTDAEAAEQDSAFSEVRPSRRDTSRSS